MSRPKCPRLKPITFIGIILLVTSCGWWIPVGDEPGTGQDPEASGPAADWDNPARGFYRWRGLSVVPGEEGHGDLDRYQRFWWYDPDKPGESLELSSSSPEDPVYDFSALIAEYRDLPPGGSFSFRIRSMYNYNPGTDLQPGPGQDKPKAYVPRYLLSEGFYSDTNGDGSSDAFIPDWNSGAYLSAVERLLENLAASLDREVPGWEAKTGFVDFGLFGQYGEWYLAHRLDPKGAKYLSLTPERQGLFQGRTTTSRPYVDYDHDDAGDILPLERFRNEPGNPRKRLLDAHLKAFSRVRLVMFFLYEQAEVLEYLFYTQNTSLLPVGTRIDALGNPGFLYRQWENSEAKRAWWEGSRWADEGGSSVEAKAFRNRWKSAPFISEFYGSTAVLGGSDDSALDQLARYRISQVSNGNFSGISGSSLVQWTGLSQEQKAQLFRIGNTAGYRMEVLSASLIGPSDSSGAWELDLQVRNKGTAPLYGAFTLQVLLRSGETVFRSSGIPGVGEALGSLAPGEEGRWTHKLDFGSAPVSGSWEASLEILFRNRPWHPAALSGALKITEEGTLALGAVFVP